MSRRQHFLSLGPPRSRPLPPEWGLPQGCKLPCPPPPGRWPSDPPPWPPCSPSSESWPPYPPPIGSWPPSPPPLRSWPPSPSLPGNWPPLSKSWPSGPPPMGSWLPNPPSPENWLTNPPSPESWPQSPPTLGSWPPGLPISRSWLPGPPISGNWPLVPLSSDLGSWPQIPPPPRSWPPCPPPPENWPPSLPPLGSWPPRPPTPRSWPPSPGSWQSSGTPANSMPPCSSYGPPPPDFMPSLTKHGSNDEINPGGLDEVKPPTKPEYYGNLGTPLVNIDSVKPDVKEKLSTKSDGNDKTISPTKHITSFEMKPPTTFADFGNSGKSPAIRISSEPASNLDDKAKPLTKPGGIDETKSLTKPEGSDEVQPLTKPGGFGTSKTPAVSIDLPKPASKQYEKERLSTELSGNDETKLGMSDELKPLTKPHGYDNSGTKSDDKDKSLTNLDDNDKTKSSTIHGGSNEVKPPTKPGHFGTSGTPPANIDISKPASKPDDKEKLSSELGGNDKPKPSGSDEVIPLTKPGGYDNYGTPLTNKDPPKLAPKPDGTEKALTNPYVNDITKSIIIHSTSNEMKPPAKLGSKDETKPPTKPSANDETKRLPWFMIRHSTQRK